MRLSRNTYNPFEDYTGDSNHCSKTANDFGVATDRGEAPYAYAKFMRFGNGRIVHQILW
jgi:hypothetical protein